MHINKLALHISFYTDQMRHSQQLFKLHCHWIMHHGHEDGVEDEADAYPEVKERVRDESVELLSEPPPASTTAPLQEEVCTDESTWSARPLVLSKR